MKIRVLGIVLVLALVLSSCATETDINEKNEDGSPIWTTIVPQSNRYVYGVGSAKLQTEQNSRTAADANARADLSRKLQVMMSDAVATYSNDSEGQMLSAFERITVQTVSISIRGIKTEQRWTAPDGTVWSLVSVSVKDLDDIYELEANEYRNKVAKDQVILQERYLELLENIAQAEAQAAAAAAGEAPVVEGDINLILQGASADDLRAAAKARYDEENSSMEAILGAISPEDLGAAIAAGFAASGYDLT